MEKPGPNKKRKVKNENRQFQEIWTEKYFYVWSHNKVVCLISKNSVAIAKEYNVKTHYETGELRKQKMLSLKRELIGSYVYKTHSRFREEESATEVSYDISQSEVSPLNDGDFVKECIEITAKKMCVNRMTIQRRIISLSGNIAEQLIEKLRSLIFFH